MRFLHLTARRVGTIEPPLGDWPVGAEPLSFCGIIAASWRPVIANLARSEEREVLLGEKALGEVSKQPQNLAIHFPAPLPGTGAHQVARLAVRAKRAAIP